MAGKSFNHYSVAAEFRDVVEEIASGRLRKDNPAARIGKVLSVNTERYTANVQLAGDKGSFNARFTPNLKPRAAGVIVRIAGKPGDYYITDILNGTGVHESYEPVKEAFDLTDGTIIDTTTLGEVQQILQNNIDAVSLDLENSFPITETQISDNAISTPKLQANSVTTEKMIIGSFDNYLEDPMFEKDLGEFWTVTSGGAILPTASRNGGRALGITNAASNQRLSPVAIMTVEPAQAYRVSMSLKNTGADIPIGGVKVGATVTGTAGSTEISILSTELLPADTWGTFGTVVTIPDGYTSMSVFYESTTTLSAGTLVIDKVSCTRAANAQLIVDGEIITQKLSVDALYAGRTIRTQPAAAGDSGIEINSLLNYMKAWNTTTNELMYHLDGDTGYVTATGIVRTAEETSFPRAELVDGINNYGGGFLSSEAGVMMYATSTQSESVGGTPSSIKGFATGLLLSGPTDATYPYTAYIQILSGGIFDTVIQLNGDVVRIVDGYLDMFGNTLYTSGGNINLVGDAGNGNINNAGNVTASGTVQGNFLYSPNDINADGTVTGNNIVADNRVRSLGTMGAWGSVGPSSQPAAPTTLAGVISVLQSYGWTA